MFEYLFTLPNRVWCGIVIQKIIWIFYKNTIKYIKKEFNYGQKSKILVEYFYIAYQSTLSPQELNPSTNMLAGLVLARPLRQKHNLTCNIIILKRS